MRTDWVAGCHFRESHDARLLLKPSFSINGGPTAVLLQCSSLVYDHKSTIERKIVALG